MQKRDMSITNPSKRYSPTRSAWVSAPAIVFVLALLACLAASAFAISTQSRDVVMPLVSTLFFILAGLIALLAWTYHRASSQNQVTYWDVAGALVLIGICVSATIEPDQLVRLLERNPR
jgi:uncharacterized membrane protein